MRREFSSLFRAMKGSYSSLGGGTRRPNHSPTSTFSLAGKGKVTYNAPMRDMELDAICSRAEDYARRLQDAGQASPELYRLQQRGAREIRRSLARFRSKLLLMSTIGSVKSGKSTLTNCLSRRNLCATKLGIETTRLPMVILASDDGTERIELYSPLAAGSLDEQEMFELVIDHLRHVETEEFAQKISIERRPITQANLDAWALGHTGAGCAAIFLAEPDATLLQVGIGIVDMPGMDGLSSNWHDEKLHAWMNENADYFLLVQSSFAALTPDTREYLKDAMERSPRPIRVVQNRIEAQFWLPEQEQENQQVRQQLNTQKQLGEFMHKIIPGSWVNAGLAWWQLEIAHTVHSPGAADDTPSAPLSRSNLAELESDILTDLRNPEATLRRNSADYLLKTLEAQDAKLKNFILSSREHISRIHEIQVSVQKLMDASRLREAIESNNLHDGRLRSDALATLARNTLNKRLDAILDMELEGYFPREWKQDKMLAQDLNRIRSKVENDLGDLLAEQETHILSPERICALTDLEKEKIAACADILHLRPEEDIRKDYIRQILSLWQHVAPDSSPLALGALKETTFAGMFNRSCSYNDTAPEWRRTGRMAVEKRMEAWKKKVNETLDMFVSRRIKALADLFATELAAYESSEQTGRSIDAAERDIRLCEKWRADLAPVLLDARRIKAGARGGEF